MYCVLKNKTIYNKITAVKSNEHYSKITLPNIFNEHIMIPKKIHMTLEDKTQSFAKNKIKQIKQQYPDWELIVYDNKDIISFIKNNFEDKVFKAYDKINNNYGAMKADVFRYCVLYILGGFYIDFTLILPDMLDTLDMSEDAYLVKLNSKNLYRQRTTSYTMYEQWAMLFKPYHPYLKTIIENITYNILNNIIPPFNFKWHDFLDNPHAGHHPAKCAVLNITGPDAFSKYINDYIVKNTKKHALLNIRRNVDKNIKKQIYKNKTHYSNFQEIIYT